MLFGQKPNFCSLLCNCGVLTVNQHVLLKFRSEYTPNSTNYRSLLRIFKIVCVKCKSQVFAKIWIILIKTKAFINMDKVGNVACSKCQVQSSLCMLVLVQLLCSHNHGLLMIAQIHSCRLCQVQSLLVAQFGVHIYVCS